MSLGVLNNISAIYAENSLTTTQASLQTTLQQLSSGSRINSGADDAAGLSIANGLAANSAALTQSSANATDGVGLLQVADGALSQVTSLLNRAVTLATEASNSGLSSSQFTAINTEYIALLGEINNIAQATDFNGAAIFSTSTTSSSISAYTTDGTSNGTVSVAVTVPIVNATALGITAVANTSGLINTSAAAAQLTAIVSAINTISLDRGTLGAAVEQLQANTTVDTNESQNLTSATSQITSANIATVVANDTSFSILEQTGISALQQSNTQAQTVLKLLQ